MKNAALMICTMVLLTLGASAQYQEPFETNWEGLTASLELLEQDETRLYVQVSFANSGEEEVSAGKPIYFRDIYLLDPATDRKIFILQDVNDRYLSGPVTDFDGNGRWWINVPAQGEVCLWGMFPALESSVETVDLVIPEIFPFEGIEVNRGKLDGAGSGKTNLFPASAALISSRRSSGAVSTRLRLSNSTERKVESNALYYRDAYLFDPLNARKYPVLKDEKGIFVAEPISDEDKGGRWWPSYMNETGKALLYMKFQAPPDQVTRIDLVVPKLLPFLNVELRGKGRVTDHSGIEDIGIARVLKNLEAVES